MWNRERVGDFGRRSRSLSNALLFGATSQALVRFLPLATVCEDMKHEMLLFFCAYRMTFSLQLFLRSCKAAEFFEMLRNGNIPEIKS